MRKFLISALMCMPAAAMATGLEIDLPLDEVRLAAGGQVEPLVPQSLSLVPRVVVLPDAELAPSVVTPDPLPVRGTGQAGQADAGAARVLVQRVDVAGRAIDFERRD